MLRRIPLRWVEEPDRPPARPRSQHSSLAIADGQGFWSEEGKCVREHAWQALLLVQPQSLPPSRPNTKCVLRSNGAVEMDTEIFSSVPLKLSGRSVEQNSRLQATRH